MAKKKPSYEEKEEDPRRPKPVTRDGAYVMMLFITLVAMIAGTVLLYLDNEEYAGKQPPKEAAPKALRLGAKADLPAAANPNPNNPNPGTNTPPAGMP